MEGGADQGQGGSPSTDGGTGVLGGAPAGGAGGDSNQTFTNYEVTGSWPEQPVAFKALPATLVFDRVELHNRFLGESCSIGDYNRDGIPDVSSGRRWYEGPFGPNLAVKEHIFRGGHDDLPRAGSAAEIVTGISDNWACYPYDMNGDGWTDIVNIASPDVDDSQNVNPKPTPQPAASAYWYENPADPDSTALWTAHLMHDDVRLEQHGLTDVDGDGRPEIFGACRDCSPTQRKGYYAGDWENPTQPWTFHAVTQQYEFPFNGLGMLHGLGFNDVNGDGQPDLLERSGVWLDAPAPTPNLSQWVNVQLYDGAAGAQSGGSHMYAFDVDGDGDSDIVTARTAHGYGMSWFEQTAPLTFTERQFLGNPSQIGTHGLVVFSQPHALQVADMDADGTPDLITGKTRFAHPNGYGDPDPDGDPVSFVFRTVRPVIPNSAPIRFEVRAIDVSGAKAGVGRQVAVGHVNTDGLMDVCVGSKVGLYVYLGE